MTTRVLYWNIENFGDNKMAASIAKRSVFTGKRRRVDVTRRRDLIRRHLNQTLADIIVIVEVSTGNQPANRLIGQNGGWNGLRDVLAYLRGTDLTNLWDWNLVPPIAIGSRGKCEGVGVFYKSILRNPAGAVIGRRYFTGPNRFSGGLGGVSFNPAAGGAPPAANYPPGINFFTANRGIPPMALYNAGQPERRCAARVSFDSVAAPGTDVNFGQLRQPYMVTFTETNVGPPVALLRHLTLFGVHSPPRFNSARAYLATLTNVNDIAALNALNETKVVLGDFNVNLFTNAGAQTTAYNPLVNGAVPPGTGVMAGGNYTLMLHPNASPWTPGHTEGYYATHLKQARSSVFWSVGARPRHYPGYGYVGSSSSDSLYSIDNVLVRAPATGAQITILNPVVGSPFSQYPWAPIPAPSPPIGTTVFGNDMPPQALPPPPPAAPPPPYWPIGRQAPPFAVWMRSTYRGTDYFGHIRSASDHLALVADV